jgi:hypothetical protein
MVKAKNVTESLEERAAKAPRLIEPDEWSFIFRRLAEELPQDKSWRVTLIGGAAMALGYGGRRATSDADVTATPVEVIRAARAIAPEFDLKRGWMNAKAEEAGYVVSSAAEEGRSVVRQGPLEVFVPSTLHMLAMKVARLAGDTDAYDAKVLLRRLNHLNTVEQIWTLIGGLVPMAHRAQARHNLENLWEMVHGSA